MNHSLRVAFCSVMTAVSVTLMFLGGVIPIGTYAFPALAGIPQIAIVIELGTNWAWPTYIAVSILSVFLAADKEAVLWYILFFGCYPIVKARIEKRRKKLPATVLKFAFFNAAAIAEFYLAMWILKIPVSSYTIFGVQMPWLFLAVGNFVFALYDYALSLLTVGYCRKIHPNAEKWLHIH